MTGESALGKRAEEPALVNWEPPVSVSPSIVVPIRLTALPSLTSKIRLVPFPWTVSRSAPGPTIVSESEMRIWP